MSTGETTYSNGSTVSDSSEAEGVGEAELVASTLVAPPGCEVVVNPTPEVGTAIQAMSAPIVREPAVSAPFSPMERVGVSERMVQANDAAAEPLPCLLAKHQRA